MVFVTVGTQPNGFLRCLLQVEKLVESGVICEEVVAQTGHTEFSSERISCIPFLSEKEFVRHISEASIVITHAGSGAVFNAIKAGKTVIAIARLHELHEMADNHQRELLRKLSEEGYILDGTDSLEEAWGCLADFTPKEADFSCDIVERLDSVISLFIKRYKSKN